MELSFAVLQGLQVAGSSLVNDGSFKMLAKLAAQSALNQTDPADITGTCVCCNTSPLLSTSPSQL